MIQFNLLPDIKQQYLKAQKQKHLVTFISASATVVAIAIFVILLLVVEVWQKKSISDLNKDISNYSGQLSGTESINKILTVQNQLKSLTGLHDRKAVASRLSTFIPQITPSQATISKLDADFSQNVISISGSADGLTTVNTYVDTLKFTTYTPNGSTQSAPAFKDVVLSSFSRSPTATSFTITASFDPAIFSEASDVTLTVPKITTTRSATEQPTDIFKASNQ